MDEITNHQISITKQSPMTESSITKPFGDWVIGDWMLFGVWNLVFGD